MFRKAISVLLFFSATTATAIAQKKMGVLEYAYNTTVKISATDSIVKKEDKETAYGEEATGLFFIFETTRGSVPAIVTNAHFLRSATTLTFFFREGQGLTNFPAYHKQQKITLKKSALLILLHPDPSVDLAVIPINPILNIFAAKKINVSYNALNESAIPKDSVMNETTPMENVYVINHPSGLQNELSSLPLVSKGSTATPFFLDHNGKKEFLVEAPVYAGATGAPVIVYQGNNITRHDEPMMGHRILLGGIVSATYTKGFDERVMMPGRYPSDVVKNYENVLVVIKSQRLLDFKKLLNELK